MEKSLFQQDKESFPASAIGYRGIELATNRWGRIVAVGPTLGWIIHFDNGGQREVPCGEFHVDHGR
jgi:hypothetical protein